MPIRPTRRNGNGPRTVREPASSSPGRSDSFRGYALVIFAAACWALGGLAAKWLFSPLTQGTGRWLVPPPGVSIVPTELSAARALASAMILGVFLLASRPRVLRIPPNEVPFLAVFGVVGLAGVHFTYFKAISLTNVATAILLEYLAPVVVLFVGVVFLGERPTWRLPAGALLSVAGCALVVGAVGGEGLLVNPAGIVWGLAAAVLFASYSLMGGRVAVRLDSYAALFYGLSFAAVFWILILGPARVFGVLAEPRLVGPVVGIAVVSTVLPFAAFLAALKHVPPANALIASTLEPVLAGAGAFVLFGESFTLGQLVGGVLVVAAIALVERPSADTPVLPPPD